MAIRILIVDDEPDIRQLVSDVLESGTGEYEINHAVDGEDALKKVATKKPDLVILDIMMPRMDGLETCRRLRASEATKSIPVILLTVKAGMESRDEGFGCGADLYMTKPFDPEELRRMVKGILSGEIKRGEKS